MIKRFYYGSTDSLAYSSLSEVTWPQYAKDYVTSFVGCSGSNSGGQNQPGFCPLLALYSGSLSNLYSYHSSPISYRTVVEAKGENFEAGAIQTRFITRADAPGVVIWGEQQLGSPLSNFSTMLNGKPVEEIIFKTLPGGSLMPLKKTQYNYVIDTRNSKIVQGYALNKKYSVIANVPDTNCPFATPIPSTVTGAFDIMRYDIMSYWTHIDTETLTEYDQDGLNPITTLTKTYFEEPLHQQPTKTELTNSKEQTVLTTLQYPQNFAATTPYNLMLQKNILTPVVGVQTTVAGQPVSELKTNYTHAGNNNFAPASVQKSINGGPLQTEGTIDLYDANGNVLQFTAKNGVPTAILWGYGGQYPVAQVVNASYATAISQLSITIPNLYVLDGAALLTELHRIRTGLPQAQVTTYTYLPIAGVSSITDPNNKTNQFEYDAFNRLLHVKDQDGYTVKQNDYLYAGANPGANFGLYFNDAASQLFYGQSCATGFQGSPELYSVPMGRWYSFVSQADANAKAQADIAANGQAYANKKATCTNNNSCIGAAYRMVNCYCEQAIKIYLTCVNNGGGNYTCTWRYRWSDGFNGPINTETVTITSCTGVDKKVVNCQCETGIKVYTGQFQNNDGTWTCIFRYRWSDNTNSTSTYTEISTTPCILFAD